MWGRIVKSNKSADHKTFSQRHIHISHLDGPPSAVDRAQRSYISISMPVRIPIIEIPAPISFTAIFSVREASRSDLGHEHFFHEFLNGRPGVKPPVRRNTSPTARPRSPPTLLPFRSAASSDSGIRTLARGARCRAARHACTDRRQVPR